LKIADSNAQFPSAALGVPCFSLIPCFLALDTALRTIKLEDDCGGDRHEEDWEGGCLVGGIKEDFFLLLRGIFLL
jgi:hypothetical protein